jgi:hypothetical protein
MALSLAVLATLLAPTLAGWTTTDIESITRCTTEYGPASNDTPSSTWLSTDTYTTTTYGNFYKTAVLTPRPSTTTVSATSTTTTYETRGNNETTTIYTSTYSGSTTVTRFETVPTTTTVTVSEVETLTVPTLTGFVPVASAFPGASLKTFGNTESDEWDIEDVYWTTEKPYGSSETIRPLDRLVSLYQSSPIPTQSLHPRAEQSRQPQKVVCTLTIQSNYFMSTVSIKQSAPTATFTRTTYVSTVTTTSTVQTKPTSIPASTVSTVQWDYYTTSTFYTTQTTTTVETVSTTPSRPDKLTNTHPGHRNSLPINNLRLRRLRHQQRHRLVQIVPHQCPFRHKLHLPAVRQLQLARRR